MIFSGPVRPLPDPSHGQMQYASGFMNSIDIRVKYTGAPAQALKRTEASTETVVDADELPHRAGARRQPIETAIDQG